MPRRTFRMTRQVTGAKAPVQAQLVARHLEQHRPAEVGALGHVQPAQRVPDALTERRWRRDGFRHPVAEVGQVIGDLQQSCALGQCRQQRRQGCIGIQVLDVAVKAVLHTQEAGKVLPAGKDVGRHDALVQRIMCLVCRGFQALAAGCLEADDGRVHGGLR